MVIIAISGSSARGVAFTVAGVGSIIVSCVFILIYVTHLAGKFPRQLIQVELHFAWLWSIFFITVSALVIASLGSAYIAAGVSGSSQRSISLFILQLNLQSKSNCA